MGGQHKISRARFLASAAGGAAAAGTLTHVARAERATPQGKPQATAAVTRGERTPQFLLLDGSNRAARLHTAHGGLAVGVVVTDASRPFPRKHIESVRYRHIVLRYRFGNSRELEREIARFLSGEPTNLSGEILDTDSGGAVSARLVFTNAAIAGVKLPALDATSKDPVHLTVRLEPELTRREPGRERAPDSRTPAPWRRSDFRLALDGADTAASSATAVKAQILKRAAGVYEVPNLIATLAESRAGELFEWHRDFVLAGRRAPEEERRGSLSYASPDGRELARVTFSGVGIVSIGPAVPGSGEVQAELYCQEAQLRVGD